MEQIITDNLSTILAPSSIYHRYLLLIYFWFKCNKVCKCLFIIHTVSSSNASDLEYRELHSYVWHNICSKIGGVKNTVGKNQC